eukprot:IDg713t1
MHRIVRDGLRDLRVQVVLWTLSRRYVNFAGVKWHRRKNWLRELLSITPKKVEEGG